MKLSADLGVVITQFVILVGLLLNRRDTKTTAKEVTHNGGSSMKDAIRRVEQGQSQVTLLIAQHTEQDAENFAELRRLIEENK